MIDGDLSTQVAVMIARHLWCLFSYYFHFDIKPVLFYEVGIGALKIFRCYGITLREPKFFGGPDSHLIE